MSRLNNFADDLIQYILEGTAVGTIIYNGIQIFLLGKLLGFSVQTLISITIIHSIAVLLLWASHKSHRHTKIGTTIIYSSCCIALFFYKWSIQDNTTIFAIETSLNIALTLMILLRRKDEQKKSE